METIDTFDNFEKSHLNMGHYGNFAINTILKIDNFLQMY